MTTMIEIDDTDFLITGQRTCSRREQEGRRIEGLLLNGRHGAIDL